MEIWNSFTEDAVPQIPDLMRIHSGDKDGLTSHKCPMILWLLDQVHSGQILSKKEKLLGCLNTCLHPVLSDMLPLIPEFGLWEGPKYFLCYLSEKCWQEGSVSNSTRSIHICSSLTLALGRCQQSDLYSTNAPIVSVLRDGDGEGVDKKRRSSCTWLSLCFHMDSKRLSIYPSD